MAEPAVPEGFSEMAFQSPFNALVGPIFERRRGEEVSIGVRIGAKHINSQGICHGGMLATLADVALGYAMWARASGTSRYVTAHLTVDYAGMARDGDWVESIVDVQRVGSRLAFANCYLLVQGKRIVHASAIFARADAPT